MHSPAAPMRCAHAREPRLYFVYILANRSKTLYVGVTSSLHRRMWQHKQGTGSEFCARYKIDRLVYYQGFDQVVTAIHREKQIKGLLRMKKIQLIMATNPAWRDLSEGWYTRHLYEPASA